MTLIIALVFLVACSAFFSASETAFSSLNQIRLKSRAEDGDASAARVLAMAEKYDKLLSTILIGNNIVNIAAASIGTILFTRALGAERGATMSTIVLTIVVLIFGEISPKSIAKDCAEKCAALSAPILQVLIWVLTPLNAMFALWKKLLSRVFRLNGDSKMSQEELLLLVDEVQQEGSIDRDEGELLKNAIGFSEQTAEDILIHRVDLTALPITAAKEEAAELFTRTKYSRLLVYEGSIDHILGTIHRKDFYVGCGVTEKPLADIVMPPVFALESEPIRQLLKKLQQAKTHVAVVLDEYGGMVGIVTLNDLVEELVGDLGSDDSNILDDDEPRIEKREDGSLVITGNVELDDLEDALGIELDQEEHDTLTGLVFDALGMIPDDGPQDITLEAEGMRIHVTSILDHQVNAAEVTLLPQTEDADEAKE